MGVSCQKPCVGAASERIVASPATTCLWQQEKQGHRAYSGSDLREVPTASSRCWPRVVGHEAVALAAEAEGQ